MRRRLYGTRFTTGCGHSWRRRYPWHTRWTLGGATTDCAVCGELLIIPAEQFEDLDLDLDLDLDAYPFEVHMPLFHLYLNRQDPRWPADGAGTGFAEF
jgi:hypothetical protein